MTEKKPIKPAAVFVEPPVRDETYYQKNLRDNRPGGPDDKKTKNSIWRKSEARKLRELKQLKATPGNIAESISEVMSLIALLLLFIAPAYLSREGAKKVQEPKAISVPGRKDPVDINELAKKLGDSKNTKLLGPNITADAACNFIDSLQPEKGSAKNIWIYILNKGSKSEWTEEMKKIFVEMETKFKKTNEISAMLNKPPLTSTSCGMMMSIGFSAMKAAGKVAEAQDLSLKFLKEFLVMLQLDLKSGDKTKQEEARKISLDAIKLLGLIK
jgi:hypothetical protein